jgi:C_GCAxxG_C_C family probable redox protein
MDPAARARSLFLTNETTFGCAETTLVALQEHFRLPNASDPSPAMALNGGIAYSGGMCGAITGAALAVGRLAEQRIDDHKEAKRIGRRIIQSLMTAFAAEHGATDCRSLTGFDLTLDHDAFIDDGTWRITCTEQIEFSIRYLERLATPVGWDAEVRRIEAGEAPADAGTPEPGKGSTES